jgi:hypothetical protein
VAAPEPTLAGRRGPKLRNTCKCQSSTQQVGEARGHETRGCTGAYLDKNAMSRAAGHVKILELTSIGRRGPELQGTWEHVDARPAPCIDLSLYEGIPGLQGTDNIL